MIHQIIAITFKELKVLWLDREALALLFAMPMFFILVMSFALEGVFEAGQKGHPIEVMVVNRNGGVLAEQTIADLKRLEGLTLIQTHEGISLTSEKADQLIRKGVYPLALLFPEGYTERIRQIPNSLQNDKPTVYLISDPAMNFQLLATVKGAIQSVIERRLLLIRVPQHFKEMFGGLGDMERQIDNMLGNQNKIERERSGVNFIHTFPTGYNVGRRPTATEQNVPAYTIFGVFFIVLTLASSFLQEKKDGTFQRILAAPLPKAALLIGKLLPYYLVNLIQIALMFSVGVIVFGMALGHLPALVMVSLALAAAANGLGLLVAALGKTEAQVNGLSVLLAITLSALGGMMVPTFIMPGLMKSLSLFTPHAWALAGYHDIIVRGLSVKQILPEVGALLGFASFFFAIALWRFRFD
ncbi:MAG: type transporter [Deltaproteobacteria bacterium]|jgi:ABC-2 type transport system permease protein|nr:type transporter [Deltaproteobacteria bacterium]